MKAIQKELTEMTMDLHNAPLRRAARTAENEYKDPAAWFRPDPDIWSPPPHHDPDVFAPPIDRCVPKMLCIRIKKKRNLVRILDKKFLFYADDRYSVQMQIIEKRLITVKVHNRNRHPHRKVQKRVAHQVNQIRGERDRL